MGENRSGCGGSRSEWGEIRSWSMSRRGGIRRECGGNRGRVWWD